MKLTLTLFFSLFYAWTFAQTKECACTEELDFVTGYYERNLASFGDNVNAKNRESYEQFKEDLRKEAVTANTKVDCFRVLTYYVEFFKDNHASIRMLTENVNEKDEEGLEKFFNSEIYKSREVYELKDEDLKQYPLTDIRGIYQLSDVYKIAIVPSKTAFRDYIGVILESKSKLWKRGQVKLEIKKVGDNRYEAFSYLRNHSLRFSGRYKLNDGILGGTWTKTSKEGGQNFSAGDSNTLDFKMLNDTTAYLRIPTFSADSRAKIDSLYELADAKIRQTPHLIIDVRDNGGGSDDNVSPLLPYIYTNPIQGDRVELLVTEDNLNLWREALKNAENDPRNYGKGDVAWFRREVKKMEKAKPNTFILRSKAGKRKIKDISEFPKSVAIIQNQNCASSCETLLFWAKQSKKTILVGENSGGYVGYGENFGLYTPCYQYRLTCTMTRYKEQRKYEAEGIAPDHPLEYTNDWIAQTLEILGEEGI